MADQIPSEIKLGLNIVLYELFYMSPEKLQTPAPFNDANRDYYLKFDPEKLKRVGMALEWASENTNFPFNKIYPRHQDMDNKHIASFLTDTLEGLVKYKLYEVKGDAIR